jgi:transposase InsO family protein
MIPDEGSEDHWRMPWKQIEPMNQRAEFAMRSLATENFRALCQEYGISAKTGYKWQKRLLSQGLERLAEYSRRPKSSPNGLGEAVVCDIIRIKRKHLAWGPRKVRAIYGRTHAETPSESSFKRVLERAGYTEKRRLRPRQETGRLRSGKRAQAPNEVWTVDFKGWWYVPGGRRCEPLTIRDEYSRYVLELRALADAQSQSVREVFEQLFERRGLPQCIRSDNGSPFAHSAALLGLTRLSAWWIALGIDLERNRPACPQDNPAHERFHLDVSKELEKPRLGEQQAELDEWRRTFNEERPHEALGMRTPAEVYCQSANKYQGTPEDLLYPGMETRRVLKTGVIVWNRQQIFLSTALQNWSVGLEPHRERFNVCFARLLLGHLDPQTASFEASIPPQSAKTDSNSSATR